MFWAKLLWLFLEYRLDPLRKLRWGWQPNPLSRGFHSRSFPPNSRKPPLLLCPTPFFIATQNLLFEALRATFCTKLPFFQWLWLFTLGRYHQKNFSLKLHFFFFFIFKTSQLEVVEGFFFSKINLSLLLKRLVISVESETCEMKRKDRLLEKIVFGLNKPNLFILDFSHFTPFFLNCKKSFSRFRKAKSHYQVAAVLYF